MENMEPTSSMYSKKGGNNGDLKRTTKPKSTGKKPAEDPKKEELRIALKFGAIVLAIAIVLELSQDTALGFFLDILAFIVLFIL